MEPTGRLWPNGEFSVGYAPCGGMERLLTPKERADKAVPPIGLSLPSNSHKERDEGAPKRGTKGLTTHGKRVLRNAAWRLQRLYGKKCLSFVTLTLPDVTYEESWYVSSNWAEICRIFYQKLARRLQAAGLPDHYCGCTEMQPARSDREGHPALHLHFVVVGRRTPRQHWSFSPSDFRALWKSVLGRYLPGERDWSAVENCQMVKRDVSSYLSKYLSKGISMDSPPRSDETGWSLPTAWYNCGLRLRRWVLDNIRRDPELMESLEYVATSGATESCCHYCFSGVIEEMAGPGPHYHVGKLRGEFMRELIEMWQAGHLTGAV